MIKGIIGKKLGMTQLFDEAGFVVPVTVVEAGPCIVVQKKTKQKDGYEALQLGFGEVKAKKLNKPMAGHFKNALKQEDKKSPGVAPKKFLREFRLENCEKYAVGDLIKADVFKEGEFVDVSGTSKGKGFAGTIKRYGNHMLKKSHGTGPVRRHAGSMSGASDPSRILKGKKMPGRMGGERVTVQGLQLFKINVQENLILIKGAVPGPAGSIVIIRNSVKSLKSEEK